MANRDGFLIAASDKALERGWSPLISLQNSWPNSTQVSVASCIAGAKRQLTAGRPTASWGRMMKWTLVIPFWQHWQCQTSNRELHAFHSEKVKLPEPYMPPASNSHYTELDQWCLVCTFQNTNLESNPSPLSRGNQWTLWSLKRKAMSHMTKPSLLWKSPPFLVWVSKGN